MKMHMIAYAGKQRFEGLVFSESFHGVIFDSGAKILAPSHEETTDGKIFVPWCQVQWARITMVIDAGEE